MSEDAMWDALRPVIRAWDPERVENAVGLGTPDVNYTNGWIELKYAPRWPPRGGPLRVDHYTPQQRGWHLRRRAAGGMCWVLLKVGTSEWLLFDGAVAARNLGTSTREQLYKLCACRWTRKPKREEMGKWLSQK